MAGTRGEASSLKKKQDKGQQGNILEDLLFDLVNALVPTGTPGGESSHPASLQGQTGNMALAKGNMGQALPGGEPMEKGPSLSYVFGDSFGDRPAFQTRDMGPMPQAPPTRPSDPNPAIPLPVQAPGLAPPMPAPNMEPNFREAAQDLYTMQNTVGEGLPPIGQGNGQMQPMMQDPTNILAQALRPIQQPQQAEQPEQDLSSNPQFQNMMRNMLLQGGGFGG